MKSLNKKGISLLAAFMFMLALDTSTAGMSTMDDKTIAEHVKSGKLVPIGNINDDNFVNNISKSIAESTDNAQKGVLYALRGIIYSKTKKIKEAVDDFQAAILYGNKSRDVYLNLGIAHITLKNYDLALDAFKKVLAMNDGDAEAYYCIGFVYLNTKEKLPEAIEALNKAIRFRKNYTQAYEGLLQAYLQKPSDMQQNKDMILSIADKIVETNPRYATGYLKRGYLYTLIKEYDKAIADFTKAVALEPQNFTLYKFRARAYMGNDKYKEALADQNKWLELTPNDPNLYLERTQTHIRLRQYDNAIADLKKYKELNPKANITELVAAIRIIQKDDVGAMKAYEEGIAKNPNNEKLYLTAANFYLDAKQASKALDILNLGVKNNPNSKIIREMRAQVAYLLGNKELANEDRKFVERK